jgi:hypothetical protein
MRYFPRAPFFLLFLLLLLISFTACHYVRRMMWIDVENHSGQLTRNIEVDYPAASFGITELPPGQTSRKVVRGSGDPCDFKISFLDASGKSHSLGYSFGDQCPREVALNVSTGMKITIKAVRR